MARSTGALAAGGTLVAGAADVLHREVVVPVGEHVGDSGFTCSAADDQVRVALQQDSPLHAVKLPPATAMGGLSMLVISSSSRIIKSCWPNIAETPTMSTARPHSGQRASEAGEGA